MKNISSVNKIASAIEEFYGKYKNYDGFNVLLLTSRVEEDDALGFFVYPEGENFPIGISYQKLEEKLLLDKDFFLKFATNLFYSISEKSRIHLGESLANDGYLFDSKKGFYVADDIILSDQDRELIPAMIAKDSVIKWRCCVCGGFLDDLDGLEKIETYLEDFKKGKPKKCEKNNHENEFSIKNGRIAFFGSPVKMESIVKNGKKDDSSGKITTGG